MAKIVPGQGVSAISGKNGGTVFASNKGGAYMRRFTRPSNPQTASQIAAREALSSWSSAWKLLTDEQRASWNAWAQQHPITDRLGAAIILSGHQAYVKINTNSQVYGTGVEYSEPPAAPEYTGLVVTSLVAIEADNDVILQLANSVGADVRVAIFLSPPVSPGVTNTNSSERLIQVSTTAESVPGTVNPINVSPAYIARFGDITGKTGQKIRAKLFVYSNGQLSQPVYASAIIS